MRNLIKLLFCCAVTFVFSGHAMASTTWTLTGTPTAGVSVAAYANTGGTNNATNHADNGALQRIKAATLHSYSGGLGVTNADSCTSGSFCDKYEGRNPEHAIDNQQRYDSVLLTFAAPVQLTEVKLGWMYNDSDITVLAYTGSGTVNITGAGTKNFVGLKYADLLSTTVNAGWTAIGHYANVGTTTAKAINNVGVPVVSSYWLIGAYNPLALTPSANPGGAVNFDPGRYDYVKLASVIGILAVPEPGSIALVGLALVGLIAMRRREQGSRPGK